MSPNPYCLREICPRKLKRKCKSAFTRTSFSGIGLNLKSYWTHSMLTVVVNPLRVTHRGLHSNGLEAILIGFFVFCQQFLNTPTKCHIKWGFIPITDNQSIVKHRKNESDYPIIRVNLRDFLIFCLSNLISIYRPAFSICKD